MNGEYEFTDVEPGDYTVVETNEPGTSWQDVSDFDESTDPVNDPDGDDSGLGANDLIPVTLEAGEDDDDNDFVEEELGTISGDVTADTNNDDLGEDPIEGIIIDLVDANGNVVAKDTTDVNGEYEFTDVEPGDYTCLLYTSDAADD